MIATFCTAVTCPSYAESHSAVTAASVIAAGSERLGRLAAFDQPREIGPKWIIL
jgi:hypothetical protein